LFRKILEFTDLKERTRDAYQEYVRGKYARSLIQYEMAADLGLMLAQHNAAFLWEKGFGIQDMGVNMTQYQNKNHAVYWHREAALQDSSTANLKLGDYHYYGVGVYTDMSKSAQFYQAASNLRHPQASFNLGYMHQYGLGLPQDYHLAKRYYDLAVEHNPSAARVPSYAALLWLQIESSLGQVGAVRGEGLRKTVATFGLAWDTAAIIFLVLTLCIALIVRQFLVP